MLDVGIRARLELVGDDLASRDRLKRNRPDKTGRAGEIFSNTCVRLYGNAKT